MSIAEITFYVSYLFLVLYMWVPPQYLLPYLNVDEY